MEDLRKQLTELMHEIEVTQLQTKWVSRISSYDIDENDATKWAAEIGHVVDEYRTSLGRLIKLLEMEHPDKDSVIESIYGWTIGITDITVPEIQEPSEYLRGVIEPLRSNTSEDEIE